MIRLQTSLDSQLSKEIKDCQSGAVLMVEIVRKKSLVGYWGNDYDNFLKVTVKQPSYVSVAKKLFTKGIALPPSPYHSFECFETNVDYDIRYFRLTKIVVLSLDRVHL